MKWTLSAIAAALLLAAAPAHAELFEGKYRVRVGLGAQVQPSFPGSGSVDWLPYPKVSFAREGEPFRFSANDDSLGFALLSSGGFSAGPAAKLTNDRTAEEVGAPVGDVSTTVEVGAFAQQFIGDSLRVRTEVRRGIGGHDSWVGSVGADYVVRDGDRYGFSIGPRALLADSKYMRTYYGVTPAVALATGLPVYRPDGGIAGVGAESNVIYAVGSRWGLFGYGRYIRLVGDAADSPIVRQFGSRDQFSAGVGVSYTFDLSL